MLKINLGNTEEKKSEQSVYDVAIIGSGPAGLSAAIYTSRALLKTVLIEKLGSGGQAAITDHIENYPGFPDGINGFDLSQKMEEQAKKFGASFENGEVRSIKKENGVFTIQTDVATYAAKSVIIASGASPKKLGVAGEENYIGRGISFCATCDASFYRDKTVAVIGGGDSAIDEGIFLTKFAKKVYIIHRRDELRASKILQERAFKNEKIEFIYSNVVDEVLGDNKIRSIRLKSVKDASTRELAIDGMFLYVGLFPNTAFASEINKDEQGYVLTDEKMRTNVDGVFCAGDCRKTPLRQVVTAVADGAVAAVAVEEYLHKLG